MSGTTPPLSEQNDGMTHAKEPLTDQLRTEGGHSPMSSQEQKVSVPPSTMARLDSAVKLLDEASRNLLAAGLALKQLAPTQQVLLDNLAEQVAARADAVRHLREGCEVPNG